MRLQCRPAREKLGNEKSSWCRWLEQPRDKLLVVLKAQNMQSKRCKCHTDPKSQSHLFKQHAEPFKALTRCDDSIPITIGFLEESLHILNVMCDPIHMGLGSAFWISKASYGSLSKRCFACLLLTVVITEVLSHSHITNDIPSLLFIATHKSQEGKSANQRYDPRWPDL